MARRALTVERSGAIQPDGNQNPDPRPRGEKGLEYEKAYSGREGCSRTETVIQNPDLGVRTGVWNGGWKEVRHMWKETELYSDGNQNPDPRSRGENGGLKYEKAYTRDEKVESGAPIV